MFENDVIYSRILKCNLQHYIMLIEFIVKLYIIALGMLCNMAQLGYEL